MPWNRRERFTDNPHRMDSTAVGTPSGGSAKEVCMEAVDVISRRIWLRRILCFAFLLTLAVLLSACSAGKPDEDGGRAAEPAPGGASAHISDVNESSFDYSAFEKQTGAVGSEKEPAPQSSAKRPYKVTVKPTDRNAVVITACGSRGCSIYIYENKRNETDKYPPPRFGQI